MCVSVGINFLNLSIFLGRNLSIELKKRLSCFLPTNANLIRIPRHTAYQVLIIRQWFYKGNNITLYTRKICVKKNVLTPAKTSPPAHVCTTWAIPIWCEIARLCTVAFQSGTPNPAPASLSTWTPHS